MARNKANSKKKTQIITGTPIYRLLCNLFNEYVRIIKNNMQKDMKLTLGHKLIEHLSNTMLVFKKAYNIKEIESKNKRIDELIDSVEDIEILTKLLTESGDLGISDATRLSSQLGEIKAQTRNWKRHNVTKLNESKEEETKEIEMMK